MMSHPWVNHNNVVLSVVMQVVHDILHPSQWIALGIKGKYLTQVHVVNIGPHCLEWDIGLAKVRNDFCQH